MTDINEQPSWEESISLISRSEKVEGGQDGPANRATKQLANRTLYLKKTQIAQSLDLSKKVGANSDFTEGATLESPRDEIIYGPIRLVWTGAYPKVIPAGSTPETTGGIGEGAWAYSSDAEIRRLLQSAEATKGIALPYGTLFDSLYYYTPEMFGAAGDGVKDDFKAIKKMLDAMTPGAYAAFNPCRTYYIELNTGDQDGELLINKSCIIDFKGALVIRKTPVKTIDNQSAVFFINGASDVKLLNCNINGNNPVGAPVDGSGNTVATDKKTALCQCIDYGVYIKNSHDVKITGKIQRCAFNIWAKASSRLHIDAVLDYAGQVIPNVTSNDLAYGAGIKLSESADFYLNTPGTGNANATAEIEPACSNGRGHVSGNLNLSSALTITDSRNMQFSSYAFRSSMGCQLIQTASDDTERNLRNINIKTIAETCSWSCLINQRANATLSARNIIVENISESARERGLYIFNQSSIPILNVMIDHNSRNTAADTVLTSGNDVVVGGDVRGVIRGVCAGVYNGLVVNGAQSQAFAPRFNLDLRECTNTQGYVISATSYADMAGSVNQVEYLLTSSAPRIRIARMVVAGNFGTYADFVMRGTNFYMQGIATTATYSNQAWVDTANGNAVKVKLS